jgi:arylformamidase
MSRLIDISLPVSNALPTWPGDPAVSLEREGKMEEGSVANISRLNAGVHTGTHVDAPLHFIPNDIGADELDLDRFVGLCQVIELAGEGRITAADLEGAGIAAETERLLIKTRNSAWWQEQPLRFHTEFRALDSTAARWVVARGLKLVGVDYLSVEPFEAEENHPTHGILLGARVGVIEGLDLHAVEPGRYRLICLPLKLVGSDGAPARTVLEVLED